jgi:spoIIIJ-associated protein
VERRLILKEFDYIKKPEEIVDFMLELMDAVASVKGQREGEELEILVEAEDDEERLIGRRFETLESLQYLVGVMQAVAGRDGQISLDVNGRRAGRDERIRIQAEELIEDVLEFGEAMKSRRLLPSERKVIHRLAAEEAGVRTYSVGDDLRKVVVIELEEEE